METKTVEKVVKRSITYGYLFTQPFSLYALIEPIFIEDTFSELDTIEYGEHSEIVRHVQLKLQTIGYYHDAIDGIYGLYTEQAVRHFQSTASIEVTGQINKETIKALINTEKKLAIKNLEDTIQLISYGEHSERVRAVQEVLYYYGYYVGNIDGIYGPLTESAINQIVAEQLVLSPSSNHQQMTKDVMSEENSIETNISTKSAKENNITVIPLTASINEQNVIQTARAYLGVPYVWGGSSPSGFDCSGFVQFVYKAHNKVIPRTVNDIWNFASHVDQPKIGDLVFFETYQPGPSHIGIYLGDGNFIHAGTSNGVQISNLHENTYWKSRYLGAKRID